MQCGIQDARCGRGCRMQDVGCRMTIHDLDGLAPQTQPHSESAASESGHPTFRPYPAFDMLHPAFSSAFCIRHCASGITRTAPAPSPAPLLLIVVLATAALVITLSAQPARTDEETARTLCATCHRLPPPDVLPRAAWRDDIVRMARIRENREVPPGEVGGPFELAPDMLAALRHYEAHAPETLAAPEPWPAVAARARHSSGGHSHRPARRLRRGSRTWSCSTWTATPARS